MSVATPIPLLQNLPDTNVIPGAGVNEYALCWDNDTAKFVLRAIPAVVTDHGMLTGLSDDDHAQYAMLTGRAGDNQSINPVIGANLITPSTTWVASPATGWSSTYNSITASAVAGSTMQPTPALSIASGNTYLVQFTVSAGTGLARVLLGGYPGSNSNYLLPGTYSAYFYTASTANLIFSATGASSSFSITNISVRLISNGTLTLQGGRVGLGVTPTTALDIAGPIRIVSSIQQETVFSVVHGDGTLVGRIGMLRGGDSGYSGIGIFGLTNINQGSASFLAMGRDSTGLSTLGIGHNSSANAYGTLFFGLNSATRRTLVLTGASGLYGSIKIGDSGGNGDYDLPLVLQPVIGKVGIGTTTPATTLHVVGAATITAGIRPAADSTTALQLQRASGISVLNVDTTNARVGIGTTAPATQLDIDAGALTMKEMTAPTGVADKAMLYTKDNGAGKTQLCCKLGNDVEIVLATQA